MDESLDDQLLNLLDSDQYYSLSEEYVREKMDIGPLVLRSLIGKIKKERAIQINLFKYNDVRYIGLESRRLDYERDKQNGTNHIEEWIKQGYYNKNDYSWLIIIFIMLLCIGLFLTYSKK